MEKKITKLFDVFKIVGVVHRWECFTQIHPMELPCTRLDQGFPAVE